MMASALGLDSSRLFEAPPAELDRHHSLKLILISRLYETRLASANLADWLKQPREYFVGPAAFDLA